MKFYFAWVKDGDVFSPDMHLLEDLKIFELHVFEEEGTRPLARVLVENQPEQWVGALEAGRASCIIAFQESADHLPQVLFQGRLVSYPTGLVGEMVALEFIALSIQRDSAHGTLIQELTTSSQWEPLFIPESQRANPPVEDLLGSMACHVYWSRTNADVRLTGHCWGSNRADLEGQHFKDTLRMAVTHTPCQEVRVNLTAQWVQRYQGSTNLEPVLRKYLEGGRIETYSGKDLEQKWWQSDKHFRLNGYRLEESELLKDPSLHSIEKFHFPGDHPLVRKALPKKRAGRKFIGHGESAPPTEGTDPVSPVTLHVKRSRYRPHLKLGWRYHQPRAEDVVLTVRSRDHVHLREDGTQKVIHQPLYDVAEKESVPYWGADLYYQRFDRIQEEGRIYQAHRSHRSSQAFEADASEWADMGPVGSYPLQAHRGVFFPTDRGRQVIQNAIAMAKAHLIASARCVDISFCCPMNEHSVPWTVDHMLRLVDPRLPGGVIEGKVKKLTFEALGHSGRFRAYVTLGCTLQGTWSEPEGVGLQDNVPLEDRALEEGVMADIPVTSAWCLEEVRTGPNGILFPAFLGASDLVRDVSLSAGADEQRETLRHLTASGPAEQEALALSPTRLHLRLEDLRGKGFLRTTYIVKGQGDLSSTTPFIIGEMER